MAPGSAPSTAVLAVEFRPPIYGVVGLTSLLLETPLTAEQREYVDGITESAEALLALVNDVLDLSKIHAGTLAIDPFEFELKTMVTGALAPFIMKARKKGLTIELRFGETVPVWVIGDPTRIRQVLSNLLDNAVKFTERGAIVVEIARCEPAEPDEIRFSVTDTGIGIAAEKLAAISAGGSGLGLAVCRHLLDLMCGRLAVHTAPGAGSTFSFTLPLAGAAPSLPLAA